MDRDRDHYSLSKAERLIESRIAIAVQLLQLLTFNVCRTITKLAKQVPVDSTIHEMMEVSR